MKSRDRFGRDRQWIEHHPAYHEMERIGFHEFGLHAAPHRPILGWPTGVSPMVKFTLHYLFSQAEFGLMCPLAVTELAAMLVLRYGSEELREKYGRRMISLDPAELMQGAQFMTEKAGGSDVGAAVTVAKRDADGTWRLWGDKWFCSNANCDLALTLARPEGAPAGTRGLAMFLVPKVLPDGTKNAWVINRLKDKLGSRSMATGEVTYQGAVAYVVGELGRGFKQMMEMVNGSRLSNAMRAAAIMRRCVLESLVHARGRAAFGAALADLPLLRASLVEMLLDAEAAASVVLHGAALFDGADAGRAEDARLLRVWTPIAKGWITARARWVASEAMNVRAGNGYTEEWPNARLLRDSYLGAIWEGTTSIVALDVQRAILKDGGFGARDGGRERGGGDGQGRGGEAEQGGYEQPFFRFADEGVVLHNRYLIL